MSLWELYVLNKDVRKSKRCPWSKRTHQDVDGMKSETLLVEQKGLLFKVKIQRVRKSGMFRNPIVASIFVLYNLLYSGMFFLICGGRHDWSNNFEISCTFICGLLYFYILLFIYTKASIDTTKLSNFSLDTSNCFYHKFLQ